MATDYWAHWYFEHPDEKGESYDDPDFDLEEITRQAESGEWDEI